MGKEFVVVGGLALVAFIVWWFFGKQHSSAETNAQQNGQTQEVTVTVDGGYTPNTVVLKQGVPARIIFHRNDPSNCLSHVVFPDFGINQELPLHQDFPIAIDTSKAGSYHYACGMNMFFGKVVVKK